MVVFYWGQHQLYNAIDHSTTLFDCYHNFIKINKTGELLNNNSKLYF